MLVVRKRGTTAFMQPGGKVNVGETSFEALQRDLLEELDVASGRISRLGRFVAEAANEPDHLVEADLFMVTLQAEPHVAAEIAEIAWIDPTAPGGIELAPLAEQTVFGLYER